MQAFLFLFVFLFFCKNVCYILEYIHCAAFALLPFSYTKQNRDYAAKIIVLTVHVVYVNTNNYLLAGGFFLACLDFGKECSTIHSPLFFSFFFLKWRLARAR